MDRASEREAQEPAKIVVHLADGTVVKGYMESAPALELEVLLGQPPRPFPTHLTLRSPQDGTRFQLDISKSKAVFFVKSFDGRRDYSEVKFFVNSPTIQGIWVQVRFKDNEYLEGVIHNSIHHLTGDGFFLKPPDPNSNNEMVYILKSSIVDYRVLGVRTTY